MRTTGAVLLAVHEEWQLAEVQLDPPRDGEVLVRMRAASICHSDDHFGSGDSLPSEKQLAAMQRTGVTPPEWFPLLGGHEGAGEVVEVGAGVTHLRPGDHVTTSFMPACGRCRFCRRGQSYLCDVGGRIFGTAMITDGTDRRFLDGRPLLAMMQLGTFCEYVVAAQESLVKVDDDVPWPAASLVACGVPTGFGAAVKRADVRPGDVVVVVGTGGVGVHAVQGASIAGARCVIAVDPVAFKRETALTLGATHAAADYREAASLVRDTTEGVMADSVILCPGVLHGKDVHRALGLTRKGGTVVVVGVGPAAEDTIPFGLAEFVNYAKEVKATLYGNLNPHVDIPALLQLYKAGKLQIDALATRTYPLRDINTAFADMREGRVMRAVLSFA